MDERNEVMKFIATADECQLRRMLQLIDSRQTMKGVREIIEKMIQANSASESSL